MVEIFCKNIEDGWVEFLIDNIGGIKLFIAMSKNSIRRSFSNKEKKEI